MTYTEKVRAILPPEMRRLFSKLNQPWKIQDYLDTLPTNFELGGESNFSPKTVFEKKTAHCFEGAVFAAAVLAFHGERPLLMDFATAYDDEDHTIALFKKFGKWGGISKTNHAVLKYRDPIYTTPHELAMSYFHEYYMWDGRKSLRGYSSPFSLMKFEPRSWIIHEEHLHWLMKDLAQTHYFPIVSQNIIRYLRRASKVELHALEIVEFPDPRT